MTRPNDIDDLVSKFLAWRLPKSVCSDLCVTNSKYEFPRYGTNLLTRDEARQMIEYLLGDLAMPTREELARAMNSVAYADHEAKWATDQWPRFLPAADAVLRLLGANT